ncbi:hypothetical protein LTS18_000121 [Coniosporium uncinatum]|uniref:Uncharacterized protein n=1 Tax=Coniosporium uncinatum TaxID=93489 RepID=A0ACC3DG42_9PEZI|nr:hypothetical protein LTS18_000121 [Coniosporium uncinatum]
MHNGWSWSNGKPNGHYGYPGYPGHPHAPPQGYSSAPAGSSSAAAAPASSAPAGSSSVAAGASSAAASSAPASSAAASSAAASSAAGTSAAAASSASAAPTPSATGCKVSAPMMLEKSGSSHMELSATFTTPTGPVGLSIAVSPEGDEHTEIIFAPGNSTLYVVRENSSLLAANVTSNTVIGYFKPYEINGVQESIHMDVFLDGSLIELYVNGRFALTTRIYPAREDSTGFGLWIGEGSSATVGGVEAWVGTANVFPERPVDSSSALVYDTPEETNDYVWWPGN